MSDQDAKDDAAKGALGLKTTPPVPFIKGEPPFCSFCGRGKGEYLRLVAAPKVNICDACVANAKQQLEDGGA